MRIGESFRGGRMIVVVSLPRVTSASCTADAFAESAHVRASQVAFSTQHVWVPSDPAGWRRITTSRS